MLIALAVLAALINRYGTVRNLIIAGVVLALVLTGFVAWKLHGTSSPEAAARKANYPLWVAATRPRKFGPRLILWSMYVLLKLYRYRWIPVPRPFGVYEARRREYRRWVYSVRKWIRGIIGIIGGKGGIGKSTIVPNLSTEERVATEEPVIAFDADSGGGVLAERFQLVGVPTLTSDDVARMIVRDGWTPNHESLSRLLAFHEASGVGITTMEKGSEIDATTMAMTLQTLLSSVNSVYVDTTPGFKEENTYGVASVVTVPILPGNIHVDADKSFIRKTLDEPGYGFRDRLARGEGVVIAISAVRWMDFNMRTVYELAELFGVDPKYIVLLPYNKWFKNTKPVPYDREKREYARQISSKYRFALSWLLRVRAEVAIEYNKRHPADPVPGEQIPCNITKP